MAAPDLRRVAKRIQSPPKSVASIGIPCKMRFADLLLSPLQRYSNQKVIDYFGYSKKEHPTLTLKEIEKPKVAEKFGGIGQDVLFGYTLRLEISRTYGCEKVG